jgi:hypothetical protein
VDALCVNVRHHARMANGSEGKDVLSSLPRSRPSRRSAKRDTTKAKSTAAKPKATPAKPRAASKPKAAPKAASKPKVAGSPRPSNATRRARESTIKPPTAKPVDQQGDRDVITTAVEAAGELARIGLTVGTQLVREATRRIPRP